MRVVITLVLYIVNAIARMAPSTAWRSGMRPVLPINIFVDYLITILWSNGQEVTWHELLGTWWINLCPRINATVPRETLTAAFNIPRAGCP